MYVCVYVCVTKGLESNARAMLDGCEAFVIPVIPHRREELSVFTRFSYGYFCTNARGPIAKSRIKRVDKRRTQDPPATLKAI